MYFGVFRCWLCWWYMDKIRLVTGYAFISYGNLVSSKSNPQAVVSLSTTKSEYIASVVTMMETLWMKELVNRLGVRCGAMTVMCDNQNSIYLTKNTFMWDTISSEVSCDGLVNVVKVPTEKNPTDMLTKVWHLASSSIVLTCLGYWVPSFMKLVEQSV